MSEKLKILRDYYLSGKIRIESELNEKGEPHGVCREFYENGQIKELSTRRNGLLEGAFAQWREDGKLLGEFVLPAGNGTFKQWHENGQIAVACSYAAGVRHGVSRVYDPDSGRCVLTEYFWQGRKVSAKKFLMLSENR